VIRLTNLKKALKEKVDKLNTTLAKFTQGSNILNTMLINQICVFNKKSRVLTQKEPKIFEELLC
jgi:hypothetical protein